MCVGVLILSGLKPALLSFSDSDPDQYSHSENPGTDLTKYCILQLSESDFFLLTNDLITGEQVEKV